MSRGNVATWTVADYEQAAQEYLERLTLEHFSEATANATQRMMTLKSLAVLRAKRPDVQVFNELLIQYPINGKLGQVCPDNMVVISDQPLHDMGSFNIPFEKGTILWVMDYVSPSNKRKDYAENLHRYCDELKIPYYLAFNPETKNLHLYRHNGVGYDRVVVNDAGRLAIPELDVEVAGKDRWTRLWHKGKLLLLPAEMLEGIQKLQARLDGVEEQIREDRRRTKEAKRRAEESRRRADEARRGREQAEAEVERLRAMLAQLQDGANP